MGEAYLEVGRDGGLETVELHGDVITIGRAPGSTIAFSSDDGVSGRHAELVRSPAGWLLRDVGSTNGTYVNGDRLLSELLLRPGDEIIVGHSRLVVRTNGDVTGSAPATGRASYLDAGEEWSGNHPGEESPLPSHPGLSARSTPQHATPLPGETHHGSRPERPADQRSRGRAHVRGVARGIQVRRSSDDDRDVLAFRVDRYDGSGNRLPPVAVQLWAYSGGQVTEGEEVDVVGDWKRGTVHARKIINISTNAEVHGLSPAVKGGLVVAYSVVILFIATIIVLIIVGG